jgi:hypothetical protein
VRMKNSTNGHSMKVEHPLEMIALK